MAGKNIITVNADNWKSEVLESDRPVLVDFWAEWCGPCRAIAPMLEELAEERSSQLKVAKVNVDENQELASEFKVRAIPTLLVIKGGAVQAQMTGAMNKSALLDRIEPHLS